MKQRFERAHMFVHTYVRYVWASQPAIESPYDFDAAAVAAAAVTAADSKFS